MSTPHYEIRYASFKLLSAIFSLLMLGILLCVLFFMMIKIPPNVSMLDGLMHFSQYINPKDLGSAYLKGGLGLVCIVMFFVRFPLVMKLGKPAAILSSEGIEVDGEMIAWDNIQDVFIQDMTYLGMSLQRSLVIQFHDDRKQKIIAYVKPNGESFAEMMDTVRKS